MDTDSNVCMYVCVYIYTHIHTANKCVCVCVCVCVCACVCVCVRACIRACVCVCLCYVCARAASASVCWLVSLPSLCGWVSRQLNIVSGFKKIVVSPPYTNIASCEKPDSFDNVTARLARQRHADCTAILLLQSTAVMHWCSWPLFMILTKMIQKKRNRRFFFIFFNPSHPSRLYHGGRRRRRDRHETETERQRTRTWKLHLQDWIVTYVLPLLSNN